MKQASLPLTFQLKPVHDANASHAACAAHTLLCAVEQLSPAHAVPLIEPTTNDGSPSPWIIHCGDDTSPGQWGAAGGGSGDGDGGSAGGAGGAGLRSTACQPRCTYPTTVTSTFAPHSLKQASLTLAFQLKPLHVGIASHAACAAHKLPCALLQPSVPPHAATPSALIRNDGSPSP